MAIDNGDLINDFTQFCVDIFSPAALLMVILKTKKIHLRCNGKRAKALAIILNLN